MGRSIALGHCVCNPRQGCPCPVFKERSVCQCAGEKLPIASGPVALTKLVRKAGCASKIGQSDLLRVLGRLPTLEHPDVLVGASAGDDAGIFRLDDERALVQTVDVFTPCVDDPHLFGQIAAANSLSDVYAMGGRPLSALSIVGFPIDDLDDAILEAILRGGIEKMAEADCPVIGGHSINDEEIKCGFAVTGLTHPSTAVRRGQAVPGDALVLTKPLGTGMVSFAAQIGRLSPACLDEAGAWMARLNRDAAEAMLSCGASACTDVTGYGLAGHLVEMVRTSGVVARIDLSALPVLAAVEGCLSAGILSGAIERNRQYALEWIDTSALEGDDSALPILYDPQTSGGLLIALPEASAERLVEQLRDDGNEAASIVGHIEEPDGEASPSRAIIETPSLANFIGQKDIATVTEKVTTPQSACCSNPPTAACCDSPPTPAVATDADDSLDLFMGFMKAANAPGLIDARNKKLMAIALSVAARCKPCLVNHVRSAQTMGVSAEEIHEAANLAISFGGCTTMMFFKEACEELGI